MNAYKIEKENFEKNFEFLNSKRIVLYGVGRFTATLVPELKGWNIVGLMDKDPQRIGESLYGLPILSKEQVRKCADAIIINTSGTYWQLIYNRISDIELPIYYRNGQLAIEKKDKQSEYAWDNTMDQLKLEIEQHDVISFDFFDTLFIRQIYMLSDISYIVACSLPYEKRNEFIALRQEMSCFNSNGIKVIYDEIAKKMKLSESCKNFLLNKEIEVEDRVLVPRTMIVDMLKYACMLEKRVFIISDMYLPKSFFLNALRRQGIDFEVDDIWISYEKGVSKKEGGLWEKFQLYVGNTASVLHIGDNEISDFQMCKKKTSFDTFRVVSKDDMLKYSSIQGVDVEATKRFHHGVLALCLSKLFQNPFLLHETKGKVKIEKLEDVGYLLFGPVIFSFLFWLFQKTRKDGINTLLFAGRDGYFLYKNYKYLCELLNDSSADACYLETSRQIMMFSNIINDERLTEYIKFPYIGKFEEYVEDRFLISFNKKDKENIGKKEINAVQDWEVIKDCLKPYTQEIFENAKETRNNYLDYLQKFDVDFRSAAIVDKSYYGTTQHLLINLLNKEIPGYYLVSDLSEKNRLYTLHEMYSCTQIDGDLSGQSASVYKNTLALESFLTSPEGMLRGMRNGEFVYAQKGKNQQHFEDKETINYGIIQFIEDMIQKYSSFLKQDDVYIDKFIDEWYRIMLQNCMYSSDVVKSFYNDNAFVHRTENNIFE